MRKLIIIPALFILFLLSPAFSQTINFDDYFISKTLRLDFIHAGDFSSESYFLEDMKTEPFWGGSRKNLIDKFGYGENKVEIYDSASGKLIYSRGFATLFQEWKATEEAKNTPKSFYETVIIPYPKNPVRVELYGRMRKPGFEKMYTLYVNPGNYFIKPVSNPLFKTGKLVYNGDPATKVDIVFLPDGYTEAEMIKFENDAKRMVEYFYGCEPFSQYKNNFNFWLVYANSDESGTDYPGKRIYKNTVINSSFYTFDIERYLMTYDIKTVRDLAGYVPYDQIYILVNSDVYGGGGIYNYYSLTSVDNKYADYVLVHEFGHGFASLADEYYTSDVATEDYYDLNFEPYEPNITTLKDFGKKWSALVDEGTPIPTPSTTEYENTIGAFEGGGYVAKGVFRPTQDCTMKSIKYNYFCPVCRNAIIEMIKFYSE